MKRSTFSNGQEGSINPRILGRENRIEPLGGYPRRCHAGGDFDNLKKGDLFVFFRKKQRELSGKVVDKYPVAESLMRLVAFFCFKRKKNQRLCEKTGWIDFMCGWSNRRNGDDVGVRPIIFEQL